MEPEPAGFGRTTTLSAWLCEVGRFTDDDAAASPLEIGERLLDRYEVRRLLGRGGMGFVYDVFDHERGCACALKTLSQLGPERVVMLKHEFRVISRVRHPNLVRPGELLEDRGRWFFTMEMVDGLEPFAWVAGDERRLRHVIAHIADVLATMHDQDVLHRDVKPANIIVGERDRVVLLDLGVARDRSRLLWFDRHAAGTSIYIAPEQITNDHPVGPGADMYSLGVVLYELATGLRPFSDVRPDQRSLPSLVELPPDLAELCGALLASDPAARPSARSVANRFDRISVRRAKHRDRMFVGRERELGHLRAALDRVISGRPASVFIHGPSGIGKTALVERFLAEVPGSGPVVFAGRCYEREGVPYKTLDGIIDAVADMLARDPQRRAAVPRSCRSLGRVFPAFRAIEGFATDDPGEPPEISEALRALFASFASPIVLFIDDLQWADHDGALALARTLEPQALPVLLIATSRERERPETLARIIGAPIDVGPLPSQDAMRLASAIIEDAEPAQLERIVRQSAGHPLLLDEVSRYASSSGTLQDLDDVIAARADVLAGGERDVLELVVIAGAPVPWAVLAVARDDCREELEQRIHSLETEGFARWQGSGATLAIDTFHDRIREALHSRMSADSRRALHARLASAFERVRPNAHAQLAVHGAGAGRRQMALQHARTAADHATAGLAHAHAAELLALALELADDADERQELRVARAAALARAWLPALAARAYADAASSERGDARRLRMLAVEQSLHAGKLELGLRELELAMRSANIRPPRRVWSALAYSLTRGIELRLPRPRVRTSHLDAVDIDVMWSAASMLAMNDALLALGYHSRALRLARDLGDPVRLGRSLALEACIQAGTGSFTESARLCAAAEQLVGDNPVAAFNVRGAYLVLDVQLGRWEDALVRASIDIVNPNVWSHAAHQLYTAHCELNLGKFVELAERCDRAHRQVRDRSDRYLELAMTVSFSSVVDLVRDDPDGARMHVERGRELLWRGGRGYFHALAAVSSLFTALYAGDYARALALWREGNTLLARKSHYGRVYLSYLGACASLGLARSKRAATPDVARRAARRLERDPIPWAAPYGALVAAQLAHIEGRRDARDRALIRAKSGFARFGAAHMIDIIERRTGTATEAETRLKLRGIAKPARFSRMLAPAFE